MKKIFISILSVAGLLIVAVLLFQEPLKKWAFGMLTDDMFVAADTDAFDAGLEVGAILPVIEATYDGRTIDNLQQFSGEKGLVVMVSRSVDWCPFCMRQAAELGALAQQFRAAGLGLVMVTYDSPEKQQAFVNQFAISYPIISDVNAKTISALQTLRPDYPPGDDNYGLPYPGTFVATPSGRIVGKWFLEGYETRISAEQLLKGSLEALSTL